MAERIGVETTLIFRGSPVLIQAGSSATPTEVPWFYSLLVRTYTFRDSRPPSIRA
jgi:hypothetical protein